tara:strand:- start:1340 stop:1792 length:453 start_codon:yes stop_codon:yes gene_type:complete
MLVTKKKYRETIQEYEDKLKKQQQNIEKLRHDKDEAEYKLKEAQEQNNTLKTNVDFYTNHTEELQAQLEEKKKVIDDMTKSDTNEVRFKISDDIRSVQPIVRFKEGVADFLMQDGYITQENSHSIQLGLLLVTADAINQIIETSSEGIKK